MAQTKTSQVKTSIRLPASMHDRLTAMDEISVSDHVRLALAAYLASPSLPVSSGFVNHLKNRPNSNDN